MNTNVYLPDWFRWRAMVYRFLAQFYLDGPTEEFLTVIHEEALMQSLATVISQKEFQDGCSLISHDLQTWSKDKSYRARLQDDYDRLFTGTGVLPDLQESLYTPGVKAIHNQPSVVVRDLYQTFGWKVRISPPKPYDHLGVELNFMAWLCKSAAQTTSSNEIDVMLSGQKQFLQQHLQCWVPGLCNAALQQADTRMFRGLARLTNGWMKNEDLEVNSMYH